MHIQHRRVIYGQEPPLYTGYLFQRMFYKVAIPKCDVEPYRVAVRDTHKMNGIQRRSNHVRTGSGTVLFNLRTNGDDYYRDRDVWISGLLPRLNHLAFVRHRERGNAVYHGTPTGQNAGYSMGARLWRNTFIVLYQLLFLHPTYDRCCRGSTLRAWYIR